MRLKRVAAHLLNRLAWEAGFELRELTVVAAQHIQQDTLTSK